MRQPRARTREAPTKEAIVTRSGARARRSYSYQQQCQAHAPADAESRESQLRLSLLHFVNERGGDANPGTADRMAQRDRAAVDVQTIGGKLQLAIAGDHLRGECFVQLDQIDLVHR